MNLSVREIDILIYMVLVFPIILVTYCHVVSFIEEKKGNRNPVPYG